MNDTQTKKTNQAALITALGSADQLLLTDANTGQVKRIEPARLNVTDLSGKEAPGTVLSLKEFTAKYIAGKAVGHALTDKSYANATAWFIEVKAGLRLNLQQYKIVVAKATGNLTGAWQNVSVLILPVHAASTAAIYTVTQLTYSSASDYEAIVCSIPMTLI